jgi:integration host factor subunit alpha
MTKADIAERIQANTGMSKKDSLDMLGEKIKISGFGNFEVKQKKDRKGRNPQTAETITIEARKILSFKPSMLLRQAMNK